MTHSENLTRKRFGNLIVLERAPDYIQPSGQHKKMWRCKCDCGTYITTYATQLKRGLSSCGCATKVRIECQAKEKAEIKAAKAEKRKKSKATSAEALKKKRAETSLQKKRRKEIRLQEDLSAKSLAAKNPGIAKEWDYISNNPLTPNDVYASSEKKVWWLCSNGHSYLATVGNRTSRSSKGCPYCSTPAKKVLKGFNDLETKYPVIASEWHPTLNGNLTTEMVAPMSKKKFGCIEKCKFAFLKHYFYTY